MKKEKEKKFDKTSWEEVKKGILKKTKHNEEYSFEKIKWEFPICINKEIEGKPQLVENVRKNIILGRETCVKIKEKKDEKFIRKIFLIDDTFDKRYSGQIHSTFKKKFFIYRVITSHKEMFFLLSEQELPNEISKFRGMAINIDDFTEISKSMRLGSATSIFFVKEFKSSIETLPPNKLLEFIKKKKINEENWLDLLAYHKPLNSFNRFPKTTEILKSAFILSGKADNYPLHLGIIGIQGSRKSKGYIETIAQKMYDEPEIIEGANSRIKGLIPSFKEKPANLGYLANCNRMGWIDELGKMIEFELSKHEATGYNVLGEINFLLEHATRQVSSGNDNTTTVKANSKFVFVMNPIKRKTNIEQHIGSIDPTTMSRILWWVQDEEENNFVMSDKGIIKLREKKEWKPILATTSDFLTIYDSCNAFTCKIDYKRLKELYNYTLPLINGKMKDIWKPRAEHHIELLIDGICKHRCLFCDYDASFEPKDIDYETTKALLTKMISGWGTEFPQRNF